MLKKKSFWAMIKPGTVLEGKYKDNRGKQITLTAEETQYRYFVEYAVYHDTNWSRASESHWHTTYEGNEFKIVDPEAALTEVKLPTLSKDFVSQCVKGSVWEFETEWRFTGYVNSEQVEHVVPAGTVVKVIDQKMRLAWYSPQEKCIVAELSPGLEVFAERQFFTGNIMDGAVCYVPAREAHVHLKLATAGKRKVYWLVEDNDGNKLLTKRYNNLGNVKASLRMRGGLVKINDDDDNWDNQPPEWVAGGENEWGTAKLPLDKGVWAAQYDHATNTLITREDMLEYMTMAKLSA
jgi:hypothetical protein